MSTFIKSDQSAPNLLRASPISRSGFVHPDQRVITGLTCSPLKDTYGKSHQAMYWSLPLCYYQGLFLNTASPKEVFLRERKGSFNSLNIKLFKIPPKHPKKVR